jgi:chloride channel protein, CIC family
MVDQPEAFTVVGMAAYFTAIVRAPLTGIVLIIGMTNSYQQMLALLAACFSAYLVADALGGRPTYEALLDRDLRHRGKMTAPQRTLTLELIVQANAPFEGKSVKELGLPPGYILVTRLRGLHETVPTANTRLEAAGRLTVVVAPHANAAVPLLWEGCASAHSPPRSAASSAPPDPASTTS